MSETVITQYDLEVGKAVENANKLSAAVKNVEDTTKKGAGAADKEVNKLDKSLDKTGKTGKKASADISKGFAGAEKALGPLGGAIGGVIRGIQGMTKAAFAFIATPLGAILGAIVVVLASLQAAFTSSEDGQNKWNKIVTISGAIVAKFVDKLADLGEFIIRIFTEPEVAIKEFSDTLQQFVLNRVEEIIGGFKGLATAVKLLFEGDFKGAAKTAGGALVDIINGFNPIAGVIKDNKDAIKEFGEELVEVSELAGQVADKRARADKLERQLLIDRKSLEIEIAGLRLKSRQQDQFTADERRQALLDAQKLEEQILAREKETLELRRDAQSLENTFARSNKENLDEEARLIASVIEVEAKRLNIQRGSQRELNSLNKEIERQLNEEIKLRAEINKQIEDLRFDAAQANRSALDQELADAERYFAELLAKEELNADQRAEVEEIRLQKLEQIRYEYAESELQNELSVIEKLREFRATATEQELLRVQNEFATLLELAGENAQLRREIEQELQNQIVEIERNAAAEKTRIAAAEISAKLAALGQLSSTIRGLLGEQAADAKALALFEIAASSATGVAGAVSAGSGLVFPANLAAIATGIAAVLGGIGQAKALLSSSSQPSFLGGGFTGQGTRTGGVDGKGGFHAINHPNEVMVDLMNPEKGIGELISRYGFSDRMSALRGGGTARAWNDKRIVDGLEGNRQAIIDTLGVGSTGRKRYKRAG